MNKILIILICLGFFSCSKTNVVVIDGDGAKEYRRMNLMVKNTNLALTDVNSSITNLQILLFDGNNKCINVIPLNSVNFDENNIYATTLTVLNTTKSVTVLANAIGYTYPAQSSFIGTTISNIFLSTTYPASLPLHYYKQPNVFYEGTGAVGDVVEGEDIKLTVNISRVISKIVIELADNLKFMDNGGRGFKTTNSASTVYINGIDSIFVVDTPAGLNLSLTEYLGNAIGFNFCQIYKVANFVQATTGGLYSDDIIVFPQINAPDLPFLIFSVTGWKGFQQIGADNPLYYGMRIKNVTFNNGLLASLKSLPRNVVIVVTINNFTGVGSPTHPNPDFQDMLDLTVEVKSWSEYYKAEGNVQ